MLLNEYRIIFGTSSYDEDARAYGGGGGGEGAIHFTNM